MLAFLKIAALLRTAQAALSNKNFKAAALTAADLLETLGLVDVATQVRAEIEAIGEGDSRGIAVNALSLIASALSAGFGWETPITVKGLPGEDALSDKLGHLADCCEMEETPKALATPDAAISPELWVALIQGALQLLSMIWAHRNPVK